MVIVIHQTKSTRATLEYNEKKLQQQEADFFMSANTNALDPLNYSKEKRMQDILSIEEDNTRCKNKCLHLSINPTVDDFQRIGVVQLKQEIHNLMDYLGYAEQPFYVYQHKDIDRMHFHIVSTRIDRQTGKKISDSNEKRKVNQFIQELEKKYNLEKQQSENRSLIVTAKSENIKESIQKVFNLLNQSNISTLQEYHDVLSGFHIKIKSAENGSVVMVQDDKGDVIRHPINLSEFEGPKVGKQLQKNEAMDQATKQKVKAVFKELFKEYRFFTMEQAKGAFMQQELLLYRLSKNGNYNVFSMKDKGIADVQYEVKKHFVRLSDFSLTNDAFFKLAREYVLKLKEGSREVSIVQNLRDDDFVVDQTVLMKCDLYQKLETCLLTDPLNQVGSAIEGYLRFKGEVLFEEKTALHRQTVEISFDKNYFINRFIRELDYELGREEKRRYRIFGSKSRLKQ